MSQVVVQILAGNPRKNENAAETRRRELLQAATLTTPCHNNPSACPPPPPGRVFVVVVSHVSIPASPTTPQIPLLPLPKPPSWLPGLSHSFVPTLNRYLSWRYLHLGCSPAPPILWLCLYSSHRLQRMVCVSSQPPAAAFAPPSEDGRTAWWSCSQREAHASLARPGKGGRFL